MLLKKWREEELRKLHSLLNWKMNKRIRKIKQIQHNSPFVKFFFLKKMKPDATTKFRYKTRRKLKKKELNWKNNSFFPAEARDQIRPNNNKLSPRNFHECKVRPSENKQIKLFTRKMNFGKKWLGELFSKKNFQQFSSELKRTWWFCP